MTIVVTVRVTDGIVLAADSATSFSDAAGNVAKIYNSANKIFNLVKVWPIGAMTYGAGSIGTESISTLSKNLRDRLTPPKPGSLAAADPMALDKSSYTIENVAANARDFLRSATRPRIRKQSQVISWDIAFADIPPRVFCPKPGKSGYLKTHAKGRFEFTKTTVLAHDGAVKAKRLIGLCSASARR